MSYYDLKPRSRHAEIGQKIYSEALYDRKGFHERVDDIDDHTWQEIFEAMGYSAIMQMTIKDI